MTHACFDVKDGTNQLSHSPANTPLTTSQFRNTKTLLQSKWTCSNIYIVSLLLQFAKLPPPTYGTTVYQVWHKSNWRNNGWWPRKGVSPNFCKCKKCLGSHILRSDPIVQIIIMKFRNLYQNIWPNINGGNKVDFEKLLVGCLSWWTGHVSSICLSAYVCALTNQPTVTHAKVAFQSMIREKPDANHRNKMFNVILVIDISEWAEGRLLDNLKVC